MSYKVLIPAAGQGKRMGAGKNKLLLELESIPLLIHTLKVFEDDPACEAVILAIHPQDETQFRILLKKHDIQKVTQLIPGGAERQQSVFEALKIVGYEEGIVLVHDGARPFVRKELIGQLVSAAENDGAAIIAVPVKDTTKIVHGHQVVETVERSSLWAVQTPQAFRVSLLRAAHNDAEQAGFIGTDDASLIERFGHPVTVVEGDYDNIKLTTPEDLFFAEAILNKRRRNQV